MPDHIDIDQEFPGHRAKVNFRGQSCWVLSEDKIAGDRKNFREIAGILDQVGGKRAKECAEWLRTLADGYA